MSEPSGIRSRARIEPSLYDREDQVTRTDLWAWQDAVRRVESGGAPHAAGAVAQQEIVSAMRRPDFYGAGAGTAVELRETHVSWVFLVGDRAFKLKKAVVFPFLDYGSAERRRLMCEREVNLNAALARDLYLGVRAVVVGNGRLELGPGGSAGAIDHVVEMRRYDESRTLAALAASGSVEGEEVANVGRVIARFHESAPVRIGHDEAPSTVKLISDGNFEALLARSDVLTRERVVSAQRFVDAFLCGRAETIVARAASGRVREGHGDLRAEHVLLVDSPAGEVQVVDCAEFDRALREGDVASDLAFLVMDLTRLRRADLARHLLDGYRAAGGDPGGDDLIAFYSAIKAWVRAKVAVLRAGEATATSEQRSAAAGEAQQLFALGERLAWRARLPLALIVCGAPASGKSALAAALSEASGLELVSSDVIRKTLAGVAVNERAPQAVYDAAASEKTYRELGRLAAQRVARDGGVIVDATFGRAPLRREFGGAFGAAAPAIFCECRLPLEVIRQRARTRMSDPERVSDAAPAIAARLAEEFEALESEIPPRRHVVLRTDQPLADVAGDLLAALDRGLMQGLRHDGTGTEGIEDG